MAETGVSRSATIEVQTTWGRPASYALLNSVRSGWAAIASPRPAGRRPGGAGRREPLSDHPIDRAAVDLDRILAPELGLELHDQIRAQFRGQLVSQPRHALG